MTTKTKTKVKKKSTKQQKRKKTSVISIWGFDLHAYLDPFVFQSVKIMNSNKTFKLTRENYIQDCRSIEREYDKWEESAQNGNIGDCDHPLVRTVEDYKNKIVTVEFI